MSNNQDSSENQFEDDYYVVEEALDIKKGRGDTQYVFLKWKGYPDSDNTWEPITNLNPEAALSICRGLKDFMRKKANAEKTGTTYKKKLEHTRRAILEWKALLKKAQADVDSSLSHHENDFDANEQAAQQNAKDTKAAVTNQKAKNTEAAKKVNITTNEKTDNPKSTKGNSTPLRQKSATKVDEKNTTNSQVSKDQTSTKADKNTKTSTESIQAPSFVNPEPETIVQSSDPAIKKREKSSVNKNSISTSTGKITPKIGTAKVTTTTASQKGASAEKKNKDPKNNELEKEVSKKMAEESTFNFEDTEYCIRKKPVAYEDVFDEKTSSSNFIPPPSTSANNILLENMSSSKGFTKKSDNNQNYSSTHNGNYSKKNETSAKNHNDDKNNKNNRNLNKNTNPNNQKQPYNYFTKKNNRNENDIIIPNMPNINQQPMNNAMTYQNPNDMITVNQTQNMFYNHNSNQNYTATDPLINQPGFMLQQNMGFKPNPPPPVQISQKYTQTSANFEDSNVAKRREEILSDYEKSERYFYDEGRKTWMVPFIGKPTRKSRERKKVITLTLKEFFQLFPEESYDFASKLIWEYKEAYDELSKTVQKNNKQVFKYLKEINE